MNDLIVDVVHGENSKMTGAHLADAQHATAGLLDRDDLDKNVGKDDLRAIALEIDHGGRDAEARDWDLDLMTPSSRSSSAMRS